MSEYTDDALDQALGDADAMGRGLGAGIDLRGALPGLDDIQREFWLTPPNQQADLAAVAPPVQGPNPGLIRPSSDMGAPPQAPVAPPQAPQATPGSALAAVGDQSLPAPGGPPAPGQPPNAAVKVPGMNDVAGSAQQADQFQAARGPLLDQKADAEYAAAQDKSNRLAGVAGQQLTELDKANAEYRTERAANEQLAQKETHAWMERWDQAIREQPDPGHYFTSEGGGLRRALWYASVAAQALANRKHPERANTMLAMARQEIEADVQRQKDAIASKRQGLVVEKGLMETDQARRSKDMMEDRDMRLARIQSLGRYLEARAQAPGPADLRAAHAAIAAELGNDAAKLANEHHKETLDSYNKDLDRRHQDRLAAFNQGQENYRQKRGFTQATNERVAGEVFKAAMAPVTAKEEAGAKREAEQTELDPKATGIFIRDRQSGKTRNIVVDKEQQAKALSEATEAANEFKDYQTLSEASKSESEMARVLQTNPAARKAAIKIAARSTKADFSRTTEVEFEKELAAGGGDFAAGSRGRELISWMTGNRDAVSSFIQKEERDFQADKGRTIVGKYNVGAHLGPNEEVIFAPPNVEGQTPKTPTTGEALTRQGVPTAGITEPRNVKQYEDALQDPERRLPPLSQEATRAVDDVRNLAGWKAPTGTHAGLTASKLADLESAAVDNIAAGYPDALRNGPPTIPAGEREAAAKRATLEIDRAIKVAQEHENNLILGSGRFLGEVDKYDHEKWMKAAAREGFDTSDPTVKADLDSLFKLAQDPDFVNRIRSRAEREQFQEH